MKFILPEGTAVYPAYDYKDSHNFTLAIDHRERVISIYWSVDYKFTIRDWYICEEDYIEWKQFMENYYIVMFPKSVDHIVGCIVPYGAVHDI